MGTIFNIYNHKNDYELVNEFLYHTYKKEKYPNWLQPRWEYFHYHPNTEEECYKTIGVWKENGEIVGLATHEGNLGEVFIMVDETHGYLKKEMIQFAEANISKKSEDNKKSLYVYVNDFDKDLENIVIEKGYQKIEYKETICQFTDDIKDDELQVPTGFTLKNLSGKSDIFKFHRIMWRGFNHEGEAPIEGIVWREKMQSAPKYNFTLNVVLESPEGNYIAYSGIWFDSINKVGYIEPVCIDPDYRKKGFGRIVVLECIRRAQKLGANVVYVESGLPFYQAIGFKPIFKRNVWKRVWNENN
ncbi:GNAT family N-acetyltransferase [Mycoplasmatota bacterium]|nr:GNAT family N-acetyltransferase [Mycoplasmatota bacterium]